MRSQLCGRVHDADVRADRFFRAHESSDDLAAAHDQHGADGKPDCAAVHQSIATTDANADRDPDSFALVQTQRQTDALSHESTYVTTDGKTVASPDLRAHDFLSTESGAIGHALKRAARSADSRPDSH